MKWGRGEDPASSEQGAPSPAREADGDTLPSAIERLLPDDVRRNPWLYLVLAAAVLGWRHREVIRAAVRSRFKRPARSA